MLCLVATPIGNLADISLRALETLKSCDYILCEDTRRSSILLKHYQIHKSLVSFHKFNEAAKAHSILEDLKTGKTIALITDAGTPGISDPGTAIVQQCILEGIKVISIPGPCAAIAAITSSGLDTDRFQFLGFLPRKAGELKAALQELLSYQGTTICYESPNRIRDILTKFQELAPNRQIVIARELTKLHEEIVRGTAEEIQKRWSDKEVKGEIILLIGKFSAEEGQDWKDLTPQEHVRQLQDAFQLSLQEAIKMAASIRGVPKREIYNQIVKS